MPAGLFEAIAAGRGGSAAAQTLSQVQHSKRSLLLLGVIATAEKSGHPERTLARRGLELLTLAQDYDPDAVTVVIRHPSVGAWAHRTVTALRGGPSTLGATPGGLAAVAAAAAIRAGAPAEIEVPVSGGIVMLPSLGAAGPVDADVATVRHADGDTQVVAAGRPVMIPRDVRDRAPGWHPLHSLHAESLDLLVDDVDPFRMPAAPNLASTAHPDRWSAAFREAWTLLKQHHPAVAEEIAALVTVVVPLAKPAHGQVSSSSPETFGAIALSEPSDACTLASTLAHEVQHVKLSALLDLVRLTRPDNGSRYYAPWREDPRPVSGLLQGAYAYLGVSGFWRQQRTLGPEIGAHIEFARWRKAAALVAEVLLASGQLTAAGMEFVRRMAMTLDGWQLEQVPEVAWQRATAEGERHQARWQASYGPIPVS